MAAVAGRLVKCGDGVSSYKVVLEHDDGRVVEHRVPTIRAGETLIREALAVTLPAAKVDPWNP
ncbi:hypothetical protein [Allosphingosinicella deserti]|uniref:Uncharacterized protein n=1 Tax=Allosphingosinicella deserti TaxID=2116704 RepID=A0A2P7QN46_9SPHN|nr:hypothetical protein [Sphingomonas deserti]PSJ39382.1 hypothetical protein C7I55_12220 [Sphingomonas deserti]